jgi:predicted MFS family arabinose efflux permease
MERNSGTNKSHDPVGRLVLPTLFLINFVSGTPSIVFGLLLIEIGQSFGSPVGITGQISMVSSILGIISAIIVGALSIRFNHKSLIIFGFALYLILAIGCSFSVNFSMMMFFYTLNGIALSIVYPMSSSLVAEYFTIDERTAAIGWLIAGGSSSYLIGAQVISYIAGVGGWRSAFLWFVLPFALLGVVMAKTCLPPVKRTQTSVGSWRYLKGFREILTYRSALSCLVGTTLRIASFQVVLLYAISLVRQQFSVPRGYASLFMTLSALCYTVGSLVTGRLVTKYGRKKMTVVATLLAALSVVIFTISSNMWLAIVTNFLSAWFFGVSASAVDSLNLEQVPGFRDTMMSLSSAAGSIGSAFGAGLGGLVILRYGYETLGITLGSVGLAATLIYYFLTLDPTKK